VDRSILPKVGLGYRLVNERERLQIGDGVVFV